MFAALPDAVVDPELNNETDASRLATWGSQDVARGCTRQPFLPTATLATQHIS
jgi:hypothetical protein